MRSTKAIRVTKNTDGRLIIELPYTVMRVARIKTIAGRCWHTIEKWVFIPASG